MIPRLCLVSFGLALALPAASAIAQSAGTFEGASGHVTSGSVRIVEQDGQSVVQLGSDFSLDSGPDPVVALGSDGYDSDTNLGELRSLTGAQDYPVPEDIDTAEYNEVYIWCREFAVPLGVASIE